MQNRWTALTARDLSQFLMRYRLAIVFLIAVGALSFLADKNGYEGDDLNSIVPMFNLQAALSGLIDIYRYDWQPLSYRLGASLYGATGWVDGLFLISPISIAIAITLLFFGLSRTTALSVLMFPLLVLLTPEIIFTGLYYNSSAPAYAAAMGAMVIVMTTRAAPATALAIGGLLGISFLFRIDFVLIAPAILVIYWIRSKDLRWPVMAGLVLTAMVVLAVLTGFIRLPILWESYQTASQELADRAASPGWDLLTKLFAATTIFSPLGWLFYGAGTLFFMARTDHRTRLYGLAIAASSLPALLPLGSLLSVKYMMPLFVILPFFGAMIWREIMTWAVSAGRMKEIRGGFVGVSVLLLFVSAALRSDPPFLFLSVTGNQQVGTHDGPRYWGGYLYGFWDVREGTASQWRPRGEALVDMVLTEGADPVGFVGPQNYFSEGSVGWRHAQLRLARQGYRGTVVGQGLIRIPVKDRVLWLAEDPAAIPVERAATGDHMRMTRGDDPRLGGKRTNGEEEAGNED